MEDMKLENRSDLQQAEIYPPNAQLGKKDVLLALLFCAGFAVVLFVLNALFYNPTIVCSTWKQIQTGNGPDILIMGNSHAFCDFDTPLIQQSTGITCGNLGSSAEHMPLTLDNLRTTLRYYTPKAIILKSNAVVSNALDIVRTEKKSFVLQDIDGMWALQDRLRTSMNNLEFEDLPLAVTQLCRSKEMWNRVMILRNLMTTGERLPKVNMYNRYDVQGWVAKDSFTGNEDEPAKIAEKYAAEYAKDKLSAKITDARVEAAFVDFLKLTQEHNIPVYIVKTPIFHYTRSIVETHKRIQDIIQDYPNVQVLHDFQMEQADIGLEGKDYYDSGHLNRRGSVKFTKYFLENYFSKWFNCDVNTDEVYGYKTEKIEEIGNGLYRYTAEVFADSVQYRFQLVDANGQITVLQDWSDVNYIDIELPPNQANCLCAIIKLEGMTEQEVEEQGLNFRFMVQNSST